MEIIGAYIRDFKTNLADNPRPHGYKKLKGEDAYRICVGDYRVIYELMMM
jgi:mRNA interferase RelE/StbE